MLSNILDRISFWSIFSVIVLLPIFFLPSTNIPIETSKTLLLVLGLVVAIISWAAARFSDGKIIIPKSILILPLLVVVGTFLISSIFSSPMNVSLFGVMLDIGSFWFMFCLFLLTFMTAVIVREDKKAKMILKGLIVSSMVVLVFQIARFFLPDVLSLGVLEPKTGNILGSWNSLGIFSGMMVLVSLFIFEFVKITKKQKIVFGILLFLSLFLVASVNFVLVWQLIGIFALILFVYKISITSTSSEEDRHKKEFPIVSFGVIILSLLFFISGQFIGSVLPNALNLYNVEVNPSFSATFDVAKEVIKQDPVLGTGPNRFSEVWSLYKSDIINNSQFWNTPFSSGSGLIPTFMVTTGLLGTLVLVVFFGMFLVIGAKNTFASIRHKKDSDILLYFLLAIYLIITTILYSAGVTLLLLAFAFIGIFIGIYSSRLEKNITFSFLDDPRKSFFSILFLVILMIASAGVTFKYAERFVSVFYFGNALSSTTIESAEVSIGRALLLNQNDLYLRTYSQVYLSKINSLLSTNTELTDEQKVSLQTSLTNAENGAIAATKYNPKNYLNFDMLGFVYKNSASLGVEGASAKAIEAYTEASRLNPKNPLLKLELARVSFIDKKMKEAKEFALESVALKPDFVQGLIFLAQIEKELGNNTSAVSYAEKALFLFPEDKDLIEYVNSLRNNTRAVVPEVTDPEVENNQ